MRYRTKPFEIEAVEFTGSNWIELDRFCGERRVDVGWLVPNFVKSGTYSIWDDDDIIAEVYDKLHSTWVGVKAGQFIIRGAKGEYYPCDAEIFNAKYEEVE
jgi:hypothetical protein